MSVPNRNGQSAEVADLQQALNAAYVPRWLSSILAFAFYGFLLVKPDIASTVLGLGGARFWTVLLWVGALFVALGFGTMVCATFIGPLLFHRFTGISYRNDRLSFARAGGYDVNGLTPIGAQIVLFAVWWAIPAEGAINSLRSGWIFVLLSLLLSIAAATGLYTILFVRHGRS